MEPSRIQQIFTLEQFLLCHPITVFSTRGGGEKHLPSIRIQLIPGSQGDTISLLVSTALPNSHSFC